MYGIYTLFFADTGLSGAEISVLLALWSAASLIVSVPAGAWADRVPRRGLLALDGGCKAAGFALMVAVPSFPTFVVGFVLWGAGSALISGAFEALVYDELVALGSRERYPALRGKLGVAEMLAVVGGTALAAPLFAVGGYPLVAAVSVAVGLAQAALAMTLPRQRPPGADDESYLVTLRAGLSEVRTNRMLRRVTILIGFLWGLQGIDEYVPLLLRAVGMPVTEIPLWAAALPLVAAAAAALAGWKALIRPAPLTVALLLGAALLAGTAPAGPVAAMPGLICCYAVLHLCAVVADARLQDSVEGTSRATVTSVSEVGAELSAIGLFVAYGFGIDAVSPSALLILGLAAPTVLLAAAVARWLPRPVEDEAAPDGSRTEERAR